MRKFADIFRTADGKLHAGTFLLVCGIFICTGLCNGMIDSLNKHFQNSFEVSKAASAFVQFFWYLAYFMLALPSGWFARRYGYCAGIVTGLSLGGAVAPLLMGRMADLFSMRTGFLLPLVCFVGVMAYGFLWKRLFQHWWIFSQELCHRLHLRQIQ